MSLTERRYGVWLQDRRVGTLNQRGDYTWFSLSEDYRNDPDREVLGLIFENDLTARHSSSLRLPAWFSNLLPEGRLREWVATDRGVPIDREVELLAQVGSDLPGAVRVLNDGQAPTEPTPADVIAAESDNQERRPWRFSLAGVGLKFSMLQQQDRLTLPASGEGGDWIVKLPDAIYSHVPSNECAMMTLAGLCGITIPEHMLVSKAALPRFPQGAWQSSEDLAYAVRRFDRDGNRKLIHMEDFAQVRNIYPYNDAKYAGSFETVARIAYRTRRTEELHEFVRRLAFNAVIENGDAHLKNWSLLYRDPQSPRLSPAYDIVATGVYAEDPKDNTFGLKFNGSRRYETIRLWGFDRLQERLGATGSHLSECAEETILKARESWQEVVHLLSGDPKVADAIERTILTNARRMLGR